VTENISIYGVYQFRRVFFMKKETQPASEASCFRVF